jgi:transposase InsO family protein
VHEADIRTQAEAHQAIFSHIKLFYNRKRWHSNLGHLAPLEDEKIDAAV